MGDIQVGVANMDNKGLYGLMEDKPVGSLNQRLQASVSFGRFENDSLSWEKFSAFSPNKYLEEVGKCATPGSVAQKKAYFEAHYKKIAERKAEIMDQEEKQMDKNRSFGSVVTDQGSVEGEEGCNVQFTCEEDKHVTDIPAEVGVGKVSEETIIVKECESLTDQEKDEVKNSLDSQRLENLEYIMEKAAVHVQEKPEEVSQVEYVEESKVREETLSNDTTGNTNEMPMKQIEKKDRTRTRNSPKPEQVRTKPTTNKIVTSKKTPPNKDIKNMMKTTTKKPSAPISKASPGFSTPKVYKPASKVTSLSTSQSSAKKEHVSSLLKNKQTAPKSLHMSLSLAPSASDPTAVTSTRKSLIMERMGDRDIVKRAFKTFQKSYDFKTPVAEQKPDLKLLKHQSPAKPTSIPSVATRQKENGRPAKASGMEKRSSTNAHRGLRSNVTAEKQQKELSKSGARTVEKTRLQKNSKDSLNPKAVSMHGSLPYNVEEPMF